MHGDEYLDIGVLVVDFFKGIKRFKFLIMLLSIVCAIGYWFLQDRSYVPMYSAKSVFTVKTIGTGSLNEVSTSYNFYYDKQTASQIGTTFPYIIRSGVFKKKLKNEIESNVINGSITASVVEDSNLVTLTVTSSSRDDALKILEAVLVVYPEISRYVIGNVDLEVIESPSVGKNPYNTFNTKIIVIKGFAIGLFAGLCVAFLYALFRRTIRGEDDLKKLTSIECIAMLPKLKNSQKGLNILDKKIDKAFSESIYSLKSRVESAVKGTEKKILMITSTDPAEGKSTTSLNLAIAMAQSGMRVVLVDCDYRKPDLHKSLRGVGKGVSISDIANSEDIASVVPFLQKEGLYYVGNTKSIRNSISVINSSDMKKALKKLKDFADIVVVDAPPCKIMADAGHLYNMVDMVLYAIRQDWADSSRILDSISELPECGSKIIGCVLTIVKSGIESYGYGYSHYGYGYGKKYKYYEDRG